MPGHMGAVAAKTFADKLKAALVARDMGVRTLAGQLANGDTARREVIRRRLNKYIHEGVTPTPPIRHEIEDLLGVERDELKDDEDEESDPAMRRAFDLFVDLMGELTARQHRTGVAA